jgi:hypothetical protein
MHPRSWLQVGSKQDVILLDCNQSRNFRAVGIELPSSVPKLVTLQVTELHILLFLL